jgi:hypothetical protein
MSNAHGCAINSIALNWYKLQIYFGGKRCFMTVDNNERSAVLVIRKVNQIVGLLLIFD